MQPGTLKPAKTWITLIVCCSLLCAGCALFPRSDRLVKIKITGLSYPHAEIVFRKETPLESDLDIFLSSHYALRLGLQWMGRFEEPTDMEKIWLDIDDENGPLTPWFTCIYRF